MTRQDKLTRRHFVQLAALGTGTICLLTRCSDAESHWRFFSDSEAKIMDVIADQIIPPDKWPGGRESGVTNFIDKQLLGPYIRFQSKYRKGLSAIQETCKKLYQKKFEELTCDEQINFLETMEAGKMTDVLWT